MRVLGLILGIIGSVFGNSIGLLWTLGATLLEALDVDTEGAVARGLGLLLAGIIGIVGTALALSKGQIAAGLMVIAAIAAFVFAGMEMAIFWMVSLPFLAGAVCTFLADKKAKAAA